MAKRAASARRRLLWDSVSITATTTGRQSLFTNAGTKTKLQHFPRISGQLPSGQRFRVDGFAVGLPVPFDVGDNIVMDGAVITFIVSDNEVESIKLKGHPRTFPQGGGIAGLLDNTEATADVTIEAINNGRPDATAVYQLDPAVVIDPKTNFEVIIDVPTALTGLTTGRWYVVLGGIYEYFLPQAAVGARP